MEGSPPHSLWSTSRVHPHCYGLKELSDAVTQRTQLWTMLDSSSGPLDMDSLTPLQQYLLSGLAYTTGSAIENAQPPSDEVCRAAFVTPNSAGLTAGARAWSKHGHRSGGDTPESLGWWGRPKGPVATINENALKLLERILEGATWRNIHALPHDILVYEVRISEGYGMRWALDRSPVSLEGAEEQEREQQVVGAVDLLRERPWVFRGFVEPMMENGHEVGWRH
ncbi:hypothetical protein DL96DRAFT_1617884 [Flagelloscypha sp. PMI_526]|nr:hypothetical protein DL96DRAFT_1617884 [Flagelloscypha sp. PMI_526]